MFKNSEYEGIMIPTYVGTYLSAFALICVLGTALIDSKKKPWPYNIPMFWAYGALLLEITTMIQSWFTFSEAWCAGPAEIGTQYNNVPCTVVAVGVIFASYVQVLWCLCLSMNLVYKFWQGKDLPGQKPFHVFIWGSSCFMAALALGLGKVGYTRGSTRCTLIALESPVATQPSEYIEGLFAYPILCLVFLTFVFTVITILMLRKLSGSSFWRSRSHEAEVRLLLFLVVYICIFTFVFGRIFNGIQKQEKIKEEYTEWITCVFNGGTKCGPIKTRPNLGMQYISDITSGVYPLFIIAVLGMYRDTFRFWAKRWDLLASGQQTDQGSDAIATHTGQDSIILEPLDHE